MIYSFLTLIGNLTFFFEVRSIPLLCFHAVLLPSASARSTTIIQVSTKTLVLKQISHFCGLLHKIHLLELILHLLRAPRPAHGPNLATPL